MHLGAEYHLCQHKDLFLKLEAFANTVKGVWEEEEFPVQDIGHIKIGKLIMLNVLYVPTLGANFYFATKITSGLRVFLVSSQRRFFFNYARRYSYSFGCARGTKQNAIAFPIH